METKTYIDPVACSSPDLPTPNLFLLTPGLIPRRIQSARLTHFITPVTLYLTHSPPANLPLAPASILTQSILQLATDLGVEAKVNLLANPAAFPPPRYPSLPSTSVTALLHLMAEVMSTLPANALGSVSSVSTGKQVAISDSDSVSDPENYNHNTSVTSG